jgi:hypothetical protein
MDLNIPCDRYRPEAWASWFGFDEIQCRQGFHEDKTRLLVMDSSRICLCCGDTPDYIRTVIIAKRTLGSFEATAIAATHDACHGKVENGPDADT